MKLSLFPLNTVLFPGGVLSLRVFETRYTDMVRRCMKESTPFGVVLIKAGKEASGPAEPELIGCTARIIGWDMNEPGILNITCLGEKRFRIESSERAADKLLVGEVQWLGESASIPLPRERATCSLLLTGIINDLDGEVDKLPADQQALKRRFAKPYQLTDSAWVANRLIEVLPIPAKAKQKLLELDDAAARIELVHTYLKQKGVVQ
jgi:Lon protease-like protein